MSEALITTLPADGRSASKSRRIVARALEEASLGDLIDEALLLVTELVTNAVVHAGTELELEISTDPDRLRVEVSDRSPGALPSVQDFLDWIGSPEESKAFADLSGLVPITVPLSRKATSHSRSTTMPCSSISVMYC